MASPQNLADEPVLDFQASLKRSLREFGPVKAAEMRDRLMAQFPQVDRGIAMGRVHPDLPFKTTDQITARQAVLIFYDVETRIVMPTIDGCRDLAAVFVDDVIE